MMPLGNSPFEGRSAEFTFIGDLLSGTTSWKTLAIPKQYSMAHIFCLGPGGVGGNGAVGANSAAAGGGGGGSGGQTSLWMPTRWLPDQLFISVGGMVGQATRVCAQPDAAANNCLAFANSGSSGGNAAAGTAGAVGNGGGVATIGNMPLAGRGHYNFFGGQNGIIGGTTGNGAALTLPVTGLIVTGGTGGAGLAGAGVAGSNGGLFTVPAGNYFPSHAGGVGGSAATTPPNDGSNGYAAGKDMDYFYGGTGGGSSHGTASGAGLYGGRGGRGHIGCGGGGGGGALTGSTQGIGGVGGPGLVIITLF